MNSEQLSEPTANAEIFEYDHHGLPVIPVDIVLLPNPNIAQTQPSRIREFIGYVSMVTKIGLENALSAYDSALIKRGL